MSAAVYRMQLVDELGNTTNEFLLPRSNYTAATAPTVTDDDSRGYVAGSLWVDRANHKIYACRDNTTGAAIWVEVSGAAISSVGPNSPGTGADDAGSIGEVAWTSPGNIVSSNDTYATATLSDAQNSDWLVATNFSMNLPAGATPIAYKVEVEAKQSTALDTIINYAQLVYGGVGVGTLKTPNLTGDLTTTDAYYAIGGSGDAWGASLSGAQVNDTSFGVRVSFRHNSTANTVSVDHIRLTVWYTGGTATPANAWTTVKKVSDEAKSANTTLANDAALSFPMAASTKYHVRLKVFFDTTANADFKYALTGPTSPTLVRVHRRHSPPSAAAGTDNETTVVDATITGSTSITTPTGTTGGWVEMDAIVHNGANAGTFAFQWAQDTSDGIGSTTVRAGSYLEYATF
jgi:hypothetical protein